MENGGNVEAEFKYWAASRDPEASEALGLLTGPHPDVQSYTTEVQDLRTCSERFNLTDHGFQVIKHTTAFLPPANLTFDFEDTEQVGSKYWPELCDLVQQELGARLVVALNSAVRTSASTPPTNPEGEENALESHTDAPEKPPPKSSPPFRFVHVDISPVGARNFLGAIRPTFFQDTGNSEKVAPAKQETFFSLRDEIMSAEEQAVSESRCGNHSQWDGANYAGPRWALFSIWRALDTVKQDPLGVTDSSSIFAVPGTYSEKKASYVSIPFPVEGEKGLENYVAANMMPLMPRPDQKHNWYYMSNQQPDEVYAIKLFDSEGWKADSKVMPCCAHSAFSIPGTQDSPPRKSIETRCLVVW